MDSTAQLYFHGNNLSVAALYDEVYFSTPAVQPKMTKMCLRCLRINPDTQRNKRLEEVAEKRPVFRHPGGRFVAGEQSFLLQTQSTHCQRRIGQMVLR